MAKEELFHVGQKAFINRDNKILVLHDYGVGLDFPGGRIQENEKDFTEALKREVREETGLEIKVGDPFVIWDNIFPENHRLAGIHVFLIGFKCKYLSGEVKISDEHDNFRWVSKDNYKEVNDRSNYFQPLEKYFQELEK